MRRAVRSCWIDRDPTDSTHVARAAEDLVRRGDVKSSFFRVDNCAEVKTVGEMFAVTIVPHPQTIDYLLLPAEAMAGFLFSLAPDPNLHLYLRQRHFELQGLDDQVHLESFIRLAFGIASVGRFPRGELIHSIRANLIHDVEVMNRCSQHWQKALAKTTN